MRAIGLVVGAMLLHGFTDPTAILASGEILDNGRLRSAVWAAWRGAVTIIGVIPIGLIMAFVIRGKVGEPKAARNEAAA